jgi:nucleoid-associated protein YgaU
MIGKMSERSPMGTERESVCPFVAYDEDRDFRSSVPDHRHRCFAESPAASRALAHQAAYCLSSAFAGCPTFIDWARREAAPPKDEPIRTLREAPVARRDVDRSTLPTGRPMAPQSTPTPSGCQRRAEWTAPPPWAPEAGIAARDSELEGDADRWSGRPGPRLPRDDAPNVEEDDGFDAAEGPGLGAADGPGLGAAEGPGLGAWSGSALGALAASGSASRGGSVGSAGSGAQVDRDAGPIPGAPLAPAFLAGRAARPGPAGGDADLPADVLHARPVVQRQWPGPAGSIPGERPRRPIPGPGRERGADRAPGVGSERIPADPSAPSWERPRRFEAYPSLKAGGGRVAALPRPVLYGLIVLIVGVALFATPFVLRIFTSGDGAGATPTPSASASAGTSAAPSITPVPSPSPVVYVVKAGDVLSRIAARFGVTVDQIVKANPQIKNPDKLALGDQLVIPPAVAPAITDGAITPGPSPSP